MTIDQLKPNKILCGPIFPEPVQVLIVIAMGKAVKLICKGLTTNKVYEPILTQDQLALLETSPDTEPFDGDPLRFRLAVEAMRLALAFEYDPYFSLSIARVDPLPHQLEAVYHYFMALPRIRFLLADDPGAGKTIMAGLLLKELKIRGLVKRTLIITPANLSFQWQREMKDKFRENFEVIRSDVLRANYGSNPWQDKNQVITSVSWVSRIEDAKESLLRSHWDLIIVDEAHKMSAASRDKTTLAYDLGAELSKMTDHYLLMTATPHKGDPDNFCLFLELLDRDVYGDVKSLEEAMRKQEAPFYLRRVKEALVSFPDPETGKVKALFTKRNVRTTEFQISPEELDFYDALTRFVEDQSIKAASEDSARGRALGFTMAMLQRRFASSVYAVRRSLQRMKEKREHILADPEGFRQSQINKRLPDDYEDLPEEEQQEIVSELEDLVASYDPASLRDEIIELGKLIQLAQLLEKQEVESKLVRLRELIKEYGIFKDPKMKLLIFTEHKDTLDFLCADGKDGRPLGRLREWGLTVTQIHGGMKIGDRDTPGTRIFAEREFRESAQVLVATEAAGEGINLQFCWLLINYDIPWNPVRLEQRMGRIHRYGQEKDCLIFNFVSTNTREGRVLHKLFERIQAIEDDLDPKRTGKVFNVLGDVFPANQLEKMIRDMYAHNQMDEELIKQRIIEQVDTKRLASITNSTLEGLAKRELNLSAIIGKSAEAKERRLVPEVIEDFFTQAAPIVGVHPNEIREGGHIYKLGKVPRSLWPVGERLEPRFGKLGREYKNIVFGKEHLKRDATLEWVTPGHPLFEAVREDVTDHVRQDLLRGAVFYDLHQAHPYRLDVFAASIKDGRNNQLHRRLFVVQADHSGTMDIRQPTKFLDLALAPKATKVPDADGLPDSAAAVLPDNEPCLILVDELLNYSSRFRAMGLNSQLYDFLLSLSGALNSRSVLVVSVPRSDMEMTPDDVADYERLTKMLDRVGKAMTMTAGTETSEIIRRRLFEWDPRAVQANGRVLLPKDAIDTCHEFGRWVNEHSQQLSSSVPADHAREHFESCYPFHPSVLSVFERKWQTVPKFQQTRGVLRMMALWIQNAYTQAYKKAHPDPLLTLGTAPVGDPLFRAAVFEQLGNRGLETAVTVDIAGRKEAFAVSLDAEASEAIGKERLHQKVATVVFFESNGGTTKSEATLPEIRLAVGHPELDLGNVETALDALTDRCYYFNVERKNYKFSLRENLNKRFSDKRANIPSASIEETARQEILKRFTSKEGIERVFFPQKSIQIADRPVLTFIIGDLTQSMAEPKDTLAMMGQMTRESGSSNRTFKSALIWVMADAPQLLCDEARKVLAWQAIDDDADDLKLDETQRRQLAENIEKCKRDLRDAVWRSYRFVFLLGKDNLLREIDLGRVSSSNGIDSPISNVLSRLSAEGEMEKGISLRLLLKNWPPAVTEWPVKSARDALYASPHYPRIIRGTEAIQDAVSKGVAQGDLAYVGKAANGSYAPFIFKSSIAPGDVEVVEETFLITKQTADAYLKTRETPPPAPDSPTTNKTEKPEQPAKPISIPPTPAPAAPPTPTRLTWTGDLPAQKWMNFYMKVLSKFASAGGLKLTVKVDVSPEGGVSKQKLDETKSALRELGLPDDVDTI